MTEQESLDLIRDMISRAREEVKDDGTLYLVWGWLVLTAALVHYGLWDLAGPGPAAWVWPLVLLPGLGYTGWWIRQKMKQPHAGKSWGGYGMQLVWTALGAVFLILTGIGFTGLISFQHLYPMYLCLYGIGTFVSGGLLRAWPLQAGALVSWLLATLAAMAGGKEQLLLLAAAMLFTYLIPGYWLRKKH